MSDNEDAADGADPDAKDLTTYQMLLDLWVQENPIKTNKLQVLLAVNGLLVSAGSIGDGFSREKWPLYLAGAAFSLVWVLSIGRTSYYQTLWDAKLVKLQRAHPGDPRFAVRDVSTEAREAAQSRSLEMRLLRVFGGVSSRWYLVASPVVLALVWLAVLLGTQLRPGPIAR